MVGWLVGWLGVGLWGYSVHMHKTHTEPTRRPTTRTTQINQVDTLIRTCRVEAHHTLLDIGFGWGGIALRAAETIGWVCGGVGGWMDGVR